MANTPTTPASIASHLTDEEIMINASRVDELSYDGEIGSCGGFSCGDYAPNIEKVAAVLRDYVRLRRLENAVKAKTNEILRHEDSDGPFELVTGNGPMWIRDTSNRMQGPAMLTAVEAINAFVEIKHLLAEAEKGEEK